MPDTYEHNHPLEEAAVILSYGGYTICVYSFEDKEPHFHVLEGNPKKPDKEYYIKIKSAEYFNHNEGKRLTLNKSARKEIVSFLTDKQVDLDITNWRYLLALWNSCNDRRRVDMNTEMPDYIRMSNNFSD